MSLCAAAPEAARAQAASGITFQSLYSFGNTQGDGYHSLAPLTQGSDGDLYGVTYFGNTAYKISPSGTYTLLHTFSSSTEGDELLSGLFLDPDGNFYSNAQYGGANGAGTIYKMTQSGVVTPLTSFTLRGPNGSDPESALTPGANGLLYGTTYNGGDTSVNGNGDGIVYSIDHSGTFALLHTFHGTDGENPRGQFLMGTDGNFYGTASSGGANGDGVVYKVTPAGVFTLLHSFNGTDGSSVFGGLIYGTDGAMYGTTRSGGANNDGEIYKIDTGGNLSIVYSFSGSDGQSPLASLILGTDGNFYGTTLSGGANNTGSLFQLTPSGTLTTLYSFSALDSNSDNGDGADVYAPMVEASDGTLYGTTLYGGANAKGTIYKLAVPSLAASIAPVQTPRGSGVRFDFNDDGHADLIWYNTVSGALSTWDMNDQSVLSANGTIASVAPGTGWVPVASTDVNGDGWPDVLWWNKNTGELSIWTLADQYVVQFGDDFATVADTNWKPVAIADVSGQNYSLVFQNTATGAISRWTMHGPDVMGYGGTLASLGPNSPWQCVGAPDLDGDGKSDLLFWNSSTGEASYWGCDLAAGKVNSFNGDIAQVQDTSWHLVGSEDTNGDGHPDLIWWNASTGAESRWLMNGTTVTQYGGTTAQVQDTTWQPTAIR